MRTRCTTWTFTLKPTRDQHRRFSAHGHGRRFAFNQAVALYILGKQVKAADPSGRPDLWVPVTGTQCIDAFNKWKVIPRSEAETEGNDPEPVQLAASCLRKLDEADKRARKAIEWTFRHPWMSELHQEVLEEGAKDAGTGMSARAKWFEGDRKGRCPGRVQFKKRHRSRLSFRVRRGVTFRPLSESTTADGGLPHRAVRLPRKLGGVVKVRECMRRLRRLLAKPETKLCHVTVSFDDGRWRMAVTLETGPLHKEEPVHGDVAPVGLDLGVKTFAVFATADAVDVLRLEHPRPWRDRLPKLQRLSRAVARKKKGSANQRRARHRLKRFHARTRRMREAFVRREVPRLAKNHGHLVIETLNTQGLMQTRRRGMARALADLAWATFITKLIQRVTWHGGRVTRAPRHYPSTRRCSRCGHLGDKLDPSIRHFHCSSCGFEADRDTNAAANLAQFPALASDRREVSSGS
ncbi:MAG: RNA-guided endonuclease TnpB family protein [Myxococcota bacterium]